MFLSKSIKNPLIHISVFLLHWGGGQILGVRFLHPIFVFLNFLDGHHVKTQPNET